jgi:hypothetical protein
VLRANRFTQNEPAHVGQHQVENDDIEGTGAEELKSRAAGSNGSAGVSLRLQMRSHQIANVSLVLDNQHMRRICICAHVVHGADYHTATSRYNFVTIC